MTCETAAIAISGGALGALVSWPATRFISDSVGLPFVFNRQNAVMAFAAATTLNLIFSILPSHKAASKSPFQALRYE